MKTTYINTIGPKTILRNIINNKVELITFWGGDPTPTPINIYRTKEGFIYEDKLAKFVREFDTAEFLRWEFEYPQELVDFLNKLPIGECNVKTGNFFTYEEFNDMEMTINGFTPKDVADMIMANMQKNANSKRGSNYTPKKKRRK